jgi:hypothetical protein
MEKWMLVFVAGLFEGVAAVARTSVPTLNP